MNETSLPHVYRVYADMPCAAIQEQIDALQAGERLVFEPGIYRGKFVVRGRGTAEAPIRIEAAQAGAAIISGADVVTGWQADGEDWTVECDLSGIPASRKHGELSGRCEQVYVDGQSLRQVLTRREIGNGCFFYDEASKRLYIRPAVFCGEARGGKEEIDKGEITGGGRAVIDRSDPAHSWQFLVKPFDPANHLIEVTKRYQIFALAGSYRADDEGASAYIQVCGMVFRASGDQPQQAMVHIGGQHQRVEDCVFEFSAARGFDVRCRSSVIRGCSARMNGQMAFSGYGEDNLVEDCVLEYNNTKHSSFVCFEQGGCKIVRSRRFVMRRVRVVGNDGPGIWYDIDNYDALIEQCWCEGNSGPGIMYEISNTAVIRNNVCWKNGYLASKDVCWNSAVSSCGIADPIYGQGILIQMSRDCEVYNNTCVGNRRVGIDVRHHPYQQAGNSGHSPERYKSERNHCYNNLLADNGWCNFDETIAPLNPTKVDEVSENNYDYQLYHNTASLMQHAGDLLAYARWGKTLGYGVMSLEEWRASRNQDAHSIQWDPAFKAPEQGNFDLEVWSPAIGNGRPVEGLTSDYLGRPRDPQHPAIGAFEPKIERPGIHRIICPAG